MRTLVHLFERVCVCVRLVALDLPAHQNRFEFDCVCVRIESADFREMSSMDPFGSKRINNAYLGHLEPRGGEDECMSRTVTDSCG